MGIAAHTIPQGGLAKLVPMRRLETPKIWVRFPEPPLSPPYFWRSSKVGSMRRIENSKIWVQSPGPPLFPLVLPTRTQTQTPNPFSLTLSRSRIGAGNTLIPCGSGFDSRRDNIHPKHWAHCTDAISPLQAPPIALPSFHPMIGP